MKYISKLFLFLACSAIIASCAKRGQLSGGPEDKSPPKLVKDKSSPNPALLFDADEIRLEFDEYVTLKSLDKNLLISPPIFPTPKVSQRGKGVAIELDKKSSLADQTTYVFDFGEAIVDFNEGNPASGFKYVFSTGDQIDSLSISGKVLDVLSKEPIEKAYVMLFSSSYDAVYDSLANYMVRSDKDGSFSLEYLRQDTFQLLALVDQNGNKKIDPEEPMAFMGDFVYTGDTTNKSISLEVFTPKSSPRLLQKKYNMPGRVYHVYDKTINKGDVTLVSPTSGVLIEPKEGTISLWYGLGAEKVLAYIGADTIDVDLSPLDTAFLDASVLLEEADKRIAPWDTLKLSFSAPLKEVNDIQLFQLIDTTIVDSTYISRDILIKTDSLIESSSDSLGSDSLVVKKVTVYDTVAVQSSFDLDLRVIHIIADWQEGFKYLMQVDSGSIIDIYDRLNDSLYVSFDIDKSDNYTDIKLRFQNLDSIYNYVCLLKEGDNLIKKYSEINIGSDSLLFEKIKLGSYSIELIEDRDGNRKWTTGDFAKRFQPEKVKSIELPKTQPGFSLDLKIDWRASTATQGSSDKIKEEDEQDVKSSSTGQKKE